MDLNGFLTPQGFSSLLGQLVSAENEQRKQAEAVFDQVKQQQPEACAGNLLAALRSAPEVEHRSFAAIMMRKVLVTDHQNIWGSISPSMQGNIKVELLKAVQEEQQKTVVRKICDTVAELGAELADEEAPGATQWPELIPFMFQCVQSGQPTLMESGLLVLGLLSQCMPEAFKPQLPALVTGLGVCLSHAVRDVQLAALRASSLFIQAMDEPSERDKFQGLLEPMLACLGTTLNAGDESSAQEALEMLIEVAEAHPRFLRKSLNGVVGAMLSIARADALEAATRSLAAEFLVTLCEARDKAPGMMRKLPNFTPSLFETLMLFLLDVEVGENAFKPRMCLQCCTRRMKMFDSLTPLKMRYVLLHVREWVAKCSRRAYTAALELMFHDLSSRQACIKPALSARCWGCPGLTYAQHKNVSQK